MKYFVIVVSLLLFSCAAQNPTSVSVTASTDLNFARALLAAQTAIDQAKTLVPANPALRAPLNTVIASYNATESAYLIYHQAIVSGATPNSAALSTQVTQLTVNVASLVQLFGGK